MNKRTEHWRERKAGWLPILFLVGLLMLSSGCGIAGDMADGVNEESQPEPNIDSEAIIVEVLVESDGEVATSLEVEVNARNHPESVYYDTINLPYKEVFTVAKDTFIPLTSTRVRAALTDDANWISCTIRYDGDIVATHRSRGDGAEAVCEKAFRLGPG